MTVLVNGTNFENTLRRVFTYVYGGTSSGMSYITFTYDIYPESASTILDPNTTSLQGGAITTGIFYPRWSAPSNGISILLDPVSILVKSGVVNKTLTCLKIYVGTGTTGGLFVVPVDTVRGPYNAVVNKVTGINTGDIITLSDLRIKVATEGAFSMNNGLANAIVKSIIGAPGGGQYNNYNFGSGSVLNSAQAAVARDLLLEIYDSPTIPSSANQAPEGTLLWSRNLSDSGGNAFASNIFTVSGPVVGYSWPGQAAAVGNGVPKYLRISQPGVFAGTHYYPEMVLQVPIGNGIGFAPAPAANMVAGQNYALGEFSFILNP